MVAFPGSVHLARPHHWFLAVAFVFLSGCGTTGGPDGPQPSRADSVDIGYGSIDKDQTSGSVSTIREEDVPDMQSKTLGEMLSRVPGVRVVDLPGGGISVRIRGTSSFQSSEEPLFVIDGMALEFSGGGLRGLNPNNIESITVLKDPGETAIYGSRGANGVILIRTKRSPR